MVVCNWIYRTAHRQRRISTFVIVLLILSPGNTDPNRYSSIFKEESDIGTFPAQDVASSFVDPIFHKCSINLKCIFVVKDTATGQYSTYSYKDQIPLNRTNLRVWQKHFERKGIKLNIRISSIGKDDYKFGSSVSSIEVNSDSYEYTIQGMNAVVLSSENGQFVKFGSFNMVDDPEASEEFISFIQSSPRAAIILLCTYDDSSVYLTEGAKQTLAQLGAQSTIGFRYSFGLVTQKDTLKPTWFREGLTVAGGGPLSITAQIEL